MLMHRPLVDSFDTNAKEPVQSWIVHRVLSPSSLASSSVDSSPGHSLIIEFCTDVPSI